MIIIRLIACADCIYVVRVTDKLIISKPQAHTHSHSVCILIAKAIQNMAIIVCVHVVFI